jgi:hypothetical protein
LCGTYDVGVVAVSLLANAQRGGTSHRNGQDNPREEYHIAQRQDGKDIIERDVEDGFLAALEFSNKGEWIMIVFVTHL